MSGECGRTSGCEAFQAWNGQCWYERRAIAVRGAGRRHAAHGSRLCERLRGAGAQCEKALLLRGRRAAVRRSRKRSCYTELQQLSIAVLCCSATEPGVEYDA